MGSSPSAFDARVTRIAAGFERGFSRGLLPTIGLEEELIILDAASLEPVDGIESVLAMTDGDRRFKAEFRAAQLEIATQVWLTVADACRELERARADLVERLAGRLRVMAAGTHPLSCRPIAVTQQPRYQEIAADYPWAARRGLPSGLHVHVGINDPKEALAVYNAARSYLPELAALASNSPFFEGSDSGLASARLKLVEDLPRTGIPPSLACWGDLAELIARGCFGGLNHLWWDLRPRPDYGTLEFRVADVQTTVEATAAIAAVCQLLVAELRSRLHQGDTLPTHSSQLVSENRWRALRDGIDGELVDLETGASVPTRERIGRLLLQLQPHAEGAGCVEEIADAWQLVELNGCARQRRAARQLGLAELPGWLADETERGGARPWATMAAIEPTVGLEL